ncbi:MAG: outer membrane beta-barrel protein [Bradymonadia bacterium]|jgi:outer membrane beta-barrel protein
MKRFLCVALHSALLLGTIACASVLLPTVAQAQTRSLQSGPAVRRQLLFRSDRVELTPGLGIGMLNPYKRSAYFALSLRYHLTNAVALGVNTHVGMIHFDTSISNEFETYSQRQSAATRPELAFAEPLLLTDLHLSYVPFHGKFNLFARHTVHFDFYVLLGVGAAVIQSDSDDVAGVAFGPSIGVGVRTFLSEQLAMNIRFQDYMYNGADVQRSDAGVARDVDESFRNHIVATVGLSIFFPSSVRVSR